MTKEDVFIGPIIRRASTEIVVIEFATFAKFNLKFSCRVKGASQWIGHDGCPQVVQALPGLWFYYGRIAPNTGGFPAGQLLEYGIATTNDKGQDADYSGFEKIVKADGLTYSNHVLPTFFLQQPSQPLRVLYGSCRKIHDDKGGKTDALVIGDVVVGANVENVNGRPTILCLGGDQIYADDVHSDVLRECIGLGQKISGDKVEKLPVPWSPAEGGRRSYLRRYSKLTSDESDNHLVLFSEYLAMYGLVWNVNNWTKTYSRLSHFTESLPRVRRLLANIPTYMIFDDHEVTDDWNLSVKWQTDAYASLLSRRIVANALAAFWLCQGYGNDPAQYSTADVKKITTLISEKDRAGKDFDAFFWKRGDKRLLDKWEFSTPTYPFVYFLDTRTNRGHKDAARRDDGAPAYLKSIDAWKATIRRLSERLKTQKSHLPLILVAAVPVFGFSTVEKPQEAISAVVGPYYLDLENWAANREHLVTFLRLMGDKNVVLLSGDVHYSFTSTVRFTVFDDRSTGKFPLSGLPTKGFRIVGMNPTYRRVYHAKFIQLNSSAFKNVAKGVVEFAAGLKNSECGVFLTEDGEWVRGKYENDQVYIPVAFSGMISDEQFAETTAESLKVSCFIKQGINNAFNARYLGEHNIGLMTVSETEVSNCFFTASGTKQSENRWNFSNERFWD